MTAMTKARATKLDTINAKRQALLASRSVSELCDMYVAARANGSAAGQTMTTWIGEELKRRNPAARSAWFEAEDAIEMEMLARGEWVNGASELAPHKFFGCP